MHLIRTEPKSLKGTGIKGIRKHSPKYPSRLYAGKRMLIAFLGWYDVVSQPIHHTGDDRHDLADFLQCVTFKVVPLVRVTNLGRTKLATRLKTRARATVRTFLSGVEKFRAI